VENPIAKGIVAGKYPPGTLISVSCEEKDGESCGLIFTSEIKNSL
jgi:hypothetical protein